MNLAIYGRLRIGLGLLLVVFWASSSLYGQSTYGSITGTITDPSGAVIPNAKVEITNQSTGAVRTTQTNADGSYEVVNLDAGTYTIVASASGFASAQFKDFPLLARDVARRDVQLQLSGGAATVVKVTGHETITDQTLTVSDSKSGGDINQLALNFRATDNTSPIKVATLAPAVQADNGGRISVAGGLPTMTSFSLDGVSTQQVRFGGPNKDMFPSVESIGEFKVNTAGNNAEFSQATDITVTTKSGGNQYHGAAFWFHQNAALNARNPFVATREALVANDFGGTLSGPISIPKVYDGRNRSFFFFTYEGTRRPRQFSLNELVPPTPWRGGDLSSVKTPIIDPTTGKPFVNNQIPVNPVSAKILDALFEQPNDPTNASVASPNFSKNQPGGFRLNAVDFRGDQNFGANHKVFVRFTHKDFNSVGINDDTAYNTKLGGFAKITEDRNLAGVWNWIIRTNLLNEFRAGWTQDNQFQSYPLAAQGAALDASFGLTGLPPPNPSGGIGDYVISGFIETNGEGRPRTIKTKIYQFSDSLTWIKGTHTIKGGFEFRKLKYQDILTFTNGDEFGDFTFDGSITGNSFADFLLGRPSITDFAANGPDAKPFTEHYGGYIQDDWKFLPNLTVNYGLRYEVNKPFDDETNQLTQFDRNFVGQLGILGRVVTQGQTGLSLTSPFFQQSVTSLLAQLPGFDVSKYIVTNEQAGFPRRLRNTWYGNVQPRLGFAYKPFNNEKTVVRASAGIYSVPVLGAVLFSLAGVHTSNFVSFTPTATNPLIFPNVFGGSTTAPICPQVACQGYRRANQRNLEDPRNIQWNFTIEQDLGRQTLLRLNYTGSHTTKLIYSPDLNQLHPNTIGYANLTATVADRLKNLKYPNFNEVLTRDNGRTSRYNAFTAEVQRRFAPDLNFEGSYTWAKNLSNALGSAPLSFNGQGGQGDNGANATDFFNPDYDKGDVIFTRRHRFVSTFFYDLPFGRGKSWGANVSRGLDAAIGGWQISGIVLLQTGPFLTPRFKGTDPSGTNPSQRSGSNFQRPDCIAGVNPNASDQTIEQFFNPAAFVQPADNIGRFGNCGEGILRGPNTKNFSMTVGKQFKVTERVQLRYEAAFANLFNRRNLDVPVTQVFSGRGTRNTEFGRVTAPQPGEQTGPRTIQMSLRIMF